LPTQHSNRDSSHGTEDIWENGLRISDATHHSVGKDFFLLSVFLITSFGLCYRFHVVSMVSLATA